MFVGAVFLSNSPLITGIKSEGKGAEYEEMLVTTAFRAGRDRVPGGARRRAAGTGHLA